MKELFAFILMSMLVTAGSVLAQTTRPAIALSVDVEDGKKMLHAVVCLNGKPCENVVLDYLVVRTFGNLQIGEDTTLDDGSSAVSFPSALPGSPDGKLHVITRIKTPAAYAGDSVSGEFPADMPPAAAVESFPRALWSPNAPLPLMLSIFVLLAGVWCSYAYVVSRIFLIRSGGKP